MTDVQRGRRLTRVRMWQQIPLIVILVVLWMLLWGSVSWLNLATGILLALFVTRVFYLPPVDLPGRFNPVCFAVFAAKFLFQLFIASFQVAGQAFAPRGIERNSVIGVQLATRSDLMTTLTAIALSLIPGSLVVEVDRERSILYLHVLNTKDADAVEKTRAKVIEIEFDLVRAFGSRTDLANTEGTEAP
jgi:multicomponent Na+:H+ antiporter subunit E